MPNEETKIDPLVQFQNLTLHMDPAILGRLLKEYVAESNHNSWDGFSPEDLTGVRTFIKDLLVYYTSNDDPSHFKTTSSVNPV